MSQGFASKEMTSTIPKDTSGLWQRPSDWLSMPDIIEGEQKIVLLYAVFNNDSNFAAFKITGDCTIDWGDGEAAEDVASGVNAQHNFVWDDYSDETLTSLGYRQALVVITPQSGQNITGIDFRIRHSTPTQQHSDGLLEMKIGAPYCISFIMDSYYTISHNMLSRFEWVGTSALTTLNTAFRRCAGLKEVVGSAWTSGVWDWTSAFQQCTSLESIHDFDTSSATVFSSTFSSCYALREVPMMDLSSVYTMSNAFSGCSLIKSFPSFDTSSCTSFYNVVSSCSLLSEFPAWDFSNATSLTSAFATCFSLRSVPDLDLSGAVDCSAMFQNCYKLREVGEITGTLGFIDSMFAGCILLTQGPTMDTSSVTSIRYLFNNCPSLNSIPEYDFSSVTNAYGAFQSCSALQQVPSLDLSSCTDFRIIFNNCPALNCPINIDTSSGTLFASMFQSCLSLADVTIDLSSATDCSSMFNGCSSLRSLSVGAAIKSFSVQNCSLDSAALDALYGELATVSGQTITVTGNYGTTGDTPSIATAKGWTVTGS